MTEREAWLALAKDAGRERARLARGGIVHGDGRTIVHNGLCGALCKLPVSEAAAGRMRKRIFNELRACAKLRRRRGLNRAYLWPLTPSGFKRRAAWARRRAAAAR